MTHIILLIKYQERKIKKKKILSDLLWNIKGNFKQCWGSVWEDQSKYKKEKKTQTQNLNNSYFDWHFTY